MQVGDKVERKPGPAGGSEVAPRPTGTLRSLLAALRLAWKADRRGVLSVVGIELVGAACLAGGVLVARELLRSVLEGDPAGSTRVALRWGVAAIALAVGASIATGAREHVRRLLAERVTRHATARLLDAAGSLDLADFEAPGLYDVLHRAAGTLEHRPAQVTDALTQLLGACTGIAALTAALVALHPALPLLLATAQLPMWLVFRLNTRDQIGFLWFATPLERQRNYLASLLTTREPAAEVRAFDLLGVVRSRWERVSDRRLEELRGLVRRRWRRFLVGQAASVVGLLITLVALLALLEDGRLRSAGAGAAVLAISQLQQRLASAAWSAALLHECAVFLKDSDTFLALAAANAAAPRGTASPGVPVVVRGSKLTFTYPGASQPALHDVTVELRGGEVVALVGENGSGKTTLAKLLAHLYRPQHGTITWDGRDTAEIDPEQLRTHISVLFQDFVHYQMSLADNIALGDATRLGDRAGIEHAGTAAGVAPLARTLPAGYDTILGRIFELGEELSLGQWQRVALARAYFRKSQLVILDEPTAALDPRAERALFDNIRSLFADRTVLLISHRFSSVRSADRIYVLGGGRLIEQGGHEELMRLGGNYAELYKLQADMYGEAGSTSATSSDARG